MEIRQFRYFIAVAEELHFTRAARRLNIGQPPLSLQIQSIERELGTMLLKRSRRKVELTPAGQLFLEQARLAVMQADRAVEMGKRAARGEVGTLRLSFVTSVPMISAFPSAIRDFRTAMPEVHLELKIKRTQEIFDSVRLETVDLGFIRPSIDTVLPKGLSSVTVHSDRLMLAVPHDHRLAGMSGPIGPDMLSDEGFILRKPDTSPDFYAQINDLCGAEGFSPRVVQEADDVTTALGLVAAGLGITIAPGALQRIGIENVVWKELSGDDTQSHVLLIYNGRSENALRDRFVAGIA